MAIELGTVTKVEQLPEEKTVRVTVKASPDEVYEDTPFATGSTGLWMVPTRGDMVEVHEIGYESYVARTPHNPFPFTMPEMKEGDFCLRLNEDTELFFNRQDDDTFELSIQSDGVVNVTAPEVNIGAEDGDLKPVAREGDSVDTPAGSGTISNGSSNVKST